MVAIFSWLMAVNAYLIFLSAGFPPLATANITLYHH
jgi:hypothetical protein